MTLAALNHIRASWQRKCPARDTGQGSAWDTCLHRQDIGMGPVGTGPEGFAGKKMGVFVIP